MDRSARTCHPSRAARNQAIGTKPSPSPEAVSRALCTTFWSKSGPAEEAHAESPLSASRMTWPSSPRSPRPRPRLRPRQRGSPHPHPAGTGTRRKSARASPCEPDLDARLPLPSPPRSRPRRRTAPLAPSNQAKPQHTESCAPFLPMDAARGRCQQARSTAAVSNHLLRQRAHSEPNARTQNTGCAVGRMSPRECVPRAIVMPLSALVCVMLMIKTAPPLDLRYDTKPRPTIIASTACSSGVKAPPPPMQQP
jgi:hypothetical protein